MPRLPAPFDDYHGVFSDDYLEEVAEGLKASKSSIRRGQGTVVFFGNVLLDACKFEPVYGDKGDFVFALSDQQALRVQQDLEACYGTIGGSSDIKFPLHDGVLHCKTTSTKPFVTQVVEKETLDLTEIKDHQTALPHLRNALVFATVEAKKYFYAGNTGISCTVQEVTVLGHSVTEINKPASPTKRKLKQLLESIKRQRNGEVLLED